MNLDENGAVSSNVGGTFAPSLPAAARQRLVDPVSIHVPSTDRHADTPTAFVLRSHRRTGSSALPATA